MSNFFIAVKKLLCIETVHTTAYHPQTNGQVGRYNCTMATQLRLYVADDPSRRDELLPVITMAYNCQPHRSTGIAPFELVIPRRIPDLTVRNLPPGTPLTNKGTLKDGSPLARKRELMARLRKQIPIVVEALSKTQQSYKRNFDHRIAIPNADVKIGDYVYTSKQDRQNKLQSKAIGPFVVIDADADASTFVIDIDGEEKRVSSDHRRQPCPPASGCHFLHRTASRALYMTSGRLSTCSKNYLFASRCRFLVRTCHFSAAMSSAATGRF